MSQVTQKQCEDWWTLTQGRMEKGWRERRGSDLNHFFKNGSDFTDHFWTCSWRRIWSLPKTEEEQHLVLGQINRMIWKGSDCKKPWESLKESGLSFYLNVQVLRLPNSYSSLALSHALAPSSDLWHELGCWRWPQPDLNSSLEHVPFSRLPPTLSPRKQNHTINQAGQVSSSGQT